MSEPVREHEHRRVRPEPANSDGERIGDVVRLRGHDQAVEVRFGVLIDAAQVDRRPMDDRTILVHGELLQTGRPSSEQAHGDPRPIEVDGQESSDRTGSLDQPRSSRGFRRVGHR